MLVLIPNPNQMAELVQAQKALIAALNASATPLFYQHSPLWIFFEGKDFSTRDFNKEELKEFAAGLSKVELEYPRAYFSDSLQRVVIGCHSRITCGSEVLQGELVLCQSTSSQAGDIPDKTDFPSLTYFPQQLKIFRVANAVRPNKHSFAVSDFVWKKLK